MLSTILVPLDGSPESNVSLPLARSLAQSRGGSIWMLRVATESVLPDDHTATHEAGQSIERIARELASSGVDVHPVIREGDAAQEIIHLSRDVGADLIVMRTRGRSGLERAVFGSVGEEVLKRSRVPLVLVRPGGRRTSHIRQLLVPVDGSAGGAVALRTAAEFARATGASIKIVQVVVPIPMWVYAAPYDYAHAAFYDSAWDEDALASAKMYVDAVAARLRGLGLPADGEARMARGVADAIVETAEQATADMIVMSTQALTGPARALLGSVADAVVRTSHCPVLLVHRADALRQEPTNSPELKRGIAASS
jgi:nucleotide-binding universal stress UspA family protein